MRAWCSICRANFRGSTAKCSPPNKAAMKTEYGNRFDFGTGTRRIAACASTASRWWCGSRCSGSEGGHGDSDEKVHGRSVVLPGFVGKVENPEPQVLRLRLAAKSAKLRSG